MFSSVLRSTPPSSSESYYSEAYGPTSKLVSTSHQRSGSVLSQGGQGSPLGRLTIPLCSNLQPFLPATLPTAASKPTRPKALASTARLLREGVVDGESVTDQAQIAQLKGAGKRKTGKRKQTLKAKKKKKKNGKKKTKKGRVGSGKGVGVKKTKVKRKRVQVFPIFAR